MMTILYAWFLADFFSGLGHWYQDRMLLKSQYPFFNGLINDNEIHHKNPIAMLKYTASENINTSVVITFPLTIILYFAGAPAVLTLSIFFLSFANLVHRFAHMPPAHVPSVVKALQRVGLFISFNHHKHHHFKRRGLVRRDEAAIRFCTMTNYVNPLLDFIQFFRILEWIFKPQRS